LPEVEEEVALSTVVVAELVVTAQVQPQYYQQATQ
jgi:hypothetical protein